MVHGILMSTQTKQPTILPSGSLEPRKFMDSISTVLGLDHSIKSYGINTNFYR